MGKAKQNKMHGRGLKQMLKLQVEAVGNEHLSWKKKVEFITYIKFCYYKRSLKQWAFTNLTMKKEIFTDTGDNEKSDKTTAIQESSVILNLKIRMKYLTFWNILIILRFIKYGSITMKKILK